MFGTEVTVYEKTLTLVYNISADSLLRVPILILVELLNI